ncbi:MAG: hypothetical protein ACOYL6_08445 [Bacteriovoracaceae bacterium]
MKTPLTLLTLMATSVTFAVSPCEQKVLTHYQNIYHKTYKAASNTFLNNFVGRKNTIAHAFGYPDMAFLHLSFNDNYYANNIIDKSGKGDFEVFEAYNKLLNSEELCHELGEEYKKPRAIKKLLLDRLKN